MCLVGKSSVVIFAISMIFLANAHECVPRDFGKGSIVCVCNATYCDSSAVNVPHRGQYRIYESGKSGNRMSEKVGSFDDNARDESTANAITIELNPDEQFQKMIGFGGAFTDSTGINVNKLSEAAQDLIIESYFGANGSRYTLGRVPIGGTDFSTRAYTYDDHPGDVTLEKWRLTDDDTMYKMPLMKKARALSPTLKFVSAAWTAPPWMKTNDNFTGFGFLRKQYYQTYAEYLMKFLMAYKNEGLNIWAISTGNEPADAISPMIKLNVMGWGSVDVSDFIAENLGPTIAASETNDTLIVIIDDQRFTLPWAAVDILRNPVARNYTAGIAVHWYYDMFIVPELIDITQRLFPDKFFLMTEGCVGNFPFYRTPVSLGDWSRAERYIQNLMQDIGHWMTGYVDWNLALDEQGGPNYIGNNVDAPIIVSPARNEFFKQPSYYAIAHFSKFIEPGSIRIGTSTSCCVDNLAFLTPHNEIVLVLYNSAEEQRSVVVMDPERGNISTLVPPYSIQTIIYRR